MIPAADATGTRDSSNDEAALVGLPPKFTSEHNMYARIVTALNARICSEYAFVATSYQSDVVNSGGMYSTRPALELTKGDPALSIAPDWSEIEVAIKCKPDTADLFSYDALSDDVLNNELRNQIPESQLIYNCQHRIFQLMVMFMGDVARLISIDHSCVLVSERILYRSNPAPILELFWRVDRLRDTPVRRGHDPTAERIAYASSLAQKLRCAAAWQYGVGYDYPRELFEKLLSLSWPWWRLTIPCTLPDGSETKRKFLVDQPHTIDPGAPGRGTSGYIAMEDKEDEDGGSDPQFVYLKDSWRILHPDIDEEGKTLSVTAPPLHEPQVSSRRL
ncbi:hypothetical protein BD413DRAFT_610991 [Trametes elegans]|nr:hypothetical protein BD413DRAFT_610991 [Trametes elegans]